jgi:Reverse transcriptase (RNA-dependent DNA polymerase)
MMMAIAAKKGYKVHQMDVKTAFLNGDLDVDVYLRLPKEIQGTYGRVKFCHLRRSLYGLKQAPRIWYETMWADLIWKGLEVSKSCPCVFKMKGKKLYLLIYVDDVLVIGPDEKEIVQAKKILMLYEVKDIGVAKYFLGVEIHQEDDGSMSLSQTS